MHVNLNFIVKMFGKYVLKHVFLYRQTEINSIDNLNRTKKHP